MIVKECGRQNGSRMTAKDTWIHLRCLIVPILIPFLAGLFCTFAGCSRPTDGPVPIGDVHLYRVRAVKIIKERPYSGGSIPRSAITPSGTNPASTGTPIPYTLASSNPASKFTLHLYCRLVNLANKETTTNFFALRFRLSSAEAKSLLSSIQGRFLKITSQALGIDWGGTDSPGDMQTYYIIDIPKTEYISTVEMTSLWSLEDQNKEPLKITPPKQFNSMEELMGFVDGNVEEAYRPKSQ